MHKVTITNVNAKEDREAWLALRRQHITATDWPKITGTSRWGTPEDVLADKQDREVESEFGTSLPMRVGTDLEPLIIERAKPLLGSGEFLSQAFVARKHLGFTPDLMRIQEDAEWALAEIKVSVKAWRGAVPADYLDQVQFQAMVLGVDQVQVIHLQLSSWQEGLRMIRSGTLPVNRLAWYQVQVNERQRNRIERQATEWWKRNILNGVLT